MLVAGGGHDTVNVRHERVKEPFGTNFDKAGGMFIIEMVSENSLLKINSKGILAARIAGTGEVGGGGGDGGPALKAQFDTRSYRVTNRATSSSAIHETAACDRSISRPIRCARYRSEAPAEKAEGSGPYCVTLDFTGTDAYIAEFSASTSLTSPPATYGRRWQRKRKANPRTARWRRTRRS